MSLAIPLENIRGVNQAVLWRLFFGHGPVNQKSIAREIHYSEKSVTRAFRFLRQYDFVEFCRGGWVLKPEVGDDMLQGIEVSAAYRRRSGSELPAANGTFDHWADQQDILDDDQDDGTFDHSAGVEDLAEEDSDGHFDHSAVEKDEVSKESDGTFDHSADQQDEGGEKTDRHFDHPDAEKIPADGTFDHPDAEKIPADGTFDHPDAEKIPEDGHFDHPDPEKIPENGHFDHPDPQKNPVDGTFVDSGGSKIEASRESTIIINTDSLNQTKGFNNNNSSASAKINKDPGAQAGIWRELSRMRIYQNSRTLGMVQLAHVTPEYVGALMDQFEAEGRGGVGWSGLFIQHCERNEPIRSRHSQMQEQFEKFFCREV
jgi:hypothetical protein